MSTSKAGSSSQRPKWVGPQAHISRTGRPGGKPKCGGRARMTFPVAEFLAKPEDWRCKKCAAGVKQ